MHGRPTLSALGVRGRLPHGVIGEESQLSETGALSAERQNLLPVVQYHSSARIEDKESMPRRVLQRQILALQKYLNSHGFSVAVSGPGSVGHETNKFGTATKKALISFQASNGLPAYGFFGPLTRAFVNGR